MPCHQLVSSACDVSGFSFYGPDLISIQTAATLLQAKSIKNRKIYNSVLFGTGRWDLKIVVNQETGTIEFYIIFFPIRNQPFKKDFVRDHILEVNGLFLRWSDLIWNLNLKFWISKWFFESICGPASYAEKPVKCRCNNVDKTRVINFRDKSCNFGRDWLRIIRIILSAVLCCIAVLSPNWFRHFFIITSVPHLPFGGLLKKYPLQSLPSYRFKIKITLNSKYI